MYRIALAAIFTAATATAEPCDSMQASAEAALSARLAIVVEDARAGILFAGFASSGADPMKLATKVSAEILPKVAEAITAYNEAARRISLVCN